MTGGGRREEEGDPRGSLRALDGSSGEEAGGSVIEGDNLEVLRHLKKPLCQAAKLIYIDPPYNTGQAFQYRDRFGGDWSAMMGPRLRLGRELLQEDGLLCVSIDDGEVHHLRLLLDQIFGAGNFVTTLIWQKVFAPKNSAKRFSQSHEYIVCYARNRHRFTPCLLPRRPESDARYVNRDGDPRGPWASDNLTARNPYSKGRWAVTCPSGREISGPPPGTFWRVSLEKFQALDADGRIHWGPKGNNVPRLKRFLGEVKGGAVPQTLWTCDEVGHTQEAKKELLVRIPSHAAQRVFDTPKPLRLLEKLIRITTTPGGSDLVVDFFAGSGTTGEAVWKVNALDGGRRRVLLVESATPTGNPSLPTLCSLTRARLHSASRSLAPSFASPPSFSSFRWEPEEVSNSSMVEELYKTLRGGRIPERSPS